MIHKILRVGIPALLAALLIAAVLALAVNARDDAPHVLKQPEEAIACANRLLQAVCDGDFEAASEEFYGTPQLAQPPEDPLAQLVWQYYVDSLEYDLPRDVQCNITHNGVTLEAEIQTVELESLTKGLRRRFEKHMEQRIQDAESTRDVYDSKGEYLPEFIDQIIYEVLQERTEKGGTVRTQTLTLSLVYGDGRWWVQPTGQVLDILSGKAGW